MLRPASRTPVGCRSCETINDMADRAFSAATAWSLSEGWTEVSERFRLDLYEEEKLTYGSCTSFARNRALLRTCSFPTICRCVGQMNASWGFPPLTSRGCERTIERKTPTRRCGDGSAKRSASSRPVQPSALSASMKPFTTPCISLRLISGRTFCLFRAETHSNGELQLPQLEGGNLSALWLVCPRCATVASCYSNLAPLEAHS